MIDESLSGLVKLGIIRRRIRSRTGAGDIVSVIEISDFGFVSDFVLRISDLR